MSTSLNFQNQLQIINVYEIITQDLKEDNKK